MQRRIRPLIIDNDFDGSPALCYSNFSSPVSSHVEENNLGKEFCKVSELPSVPTIKEVLPARIEMNQKDLAELTTLRERNKVLETQVQLLQQQLRERERTELELKRRILEMEAEIKVWRTKCEMQKPAVFGTREQSDTGDEFPADLISKLDSAAEKLSRLNAVKDLKMLQSEMETALKEIQDK